MQPVPVLLYHSVDDDPPDWIGPFTVSRRAFVRQLDEIAERGYTVVPLAQAVAAMSGGPALPERAIVLTFDDGFLDFHAFVLPELRKREMPATLYVTTGALADAPDSLLPPARMLTWRQVGELDCAEAGVEIGAHTRSHPQLDLLSRAVATAEIKQPKEQLEDFLGHAVTAFAYPHGYSTKAVRRIVLDAGFTSATAVLNAFSSLADDPYQIARLTLRADTSPEQFSHWLSGGGAQVAPFREHLYAKAYRNYRRTRVALGMRGTL